MVIDNGKIRFLLFSHSYSAKLIVSNLTTKKDSGKSINKEISLLARVLRLERRKINELVLNKKFSKDAQKNRSVNLQIFLQIEKELAFLATEKLNWYSTIKDDYQRQLLYPAIERIAGNSLSKIKDDTKFQELLTIKIREYGNIYYKVAHKYKLPTMRIVPFILRLISDD